MMKIRAGYFVLSLLVCVLLYHLSSYLLLDTDSYLFYIFPAVLFIGINVYFRGSMQEMRETAVISAAVGLLFPVLEFFVVNMLYLAGQRYPIPENLVPPLIFHGTPPDSILMFSIYSMLVAAVIGMGLHFIFRKQPKEML